MKKLFVYLLAAISIFSIPFAIALAASLKAGEALIVNAPFSDDAYIAGGKVDIDSDIEGDLVVGGGIVSINGNIKGDLLVAGGVVDVNGNVADDLRAAGGKITVRGNVGDDIAATGGNINIESKAVIGGDFIFAGGDIFVYGKIGGNLKGAAEFVVLSSEVKGNVDLKLSERFKVLEGTKISGDLKYAFTKEIPDLQKYVSGKIDYTPIKKAVPEKQKRSLGSIFLGFKFFSYLAFLLIGVILILLFPNTFIFLSANPEKNIFKNIGIGFVSFASLLAIILISFLSIIGIYFGIILALLIPLLIVFAKIAASYTFGNILINIEKAGNIKKILVFALGLLVYKIIVLIPFLGWIVSFLAILYMIGRIYLFKKGKYLYLRKKRMI